MKSNASSGHMVRALHSSLDPNSADYYPQSHYFRPPVQGGQGVGGVSNSVNAAPFNPTRGAGGVGSSAVYGGSTAGERRNNNTTNTSNAIGVGGVGGAGGGGGLHHHALTANGVYYPSQSQSPVGVGGVAMYGGGGHQIGGASLPIPTAIVGGVPVPPSRMHGGKGAGQLAVGPNGVQVILSHTAVNHGKISNTGVGGVGSGVGSASLLSPATSGSVAAAAMIRQSPAAAVLAASMGSGTSSVISSGNAKGGGGGSNGQRRGASNNTSDTSNIASSATQLGAGSSSSSLPMPRSSTQLRGGAAAYAGPALGLRTNSNSNAPMAKDPFFSSSAPSFQAKDILENLASSIVPAAINGEWAGSTPKFGPANPEASADKQLQSIFDQLFTLTTDISPPSDRSLVPQQQQYQQQTGPSLSVPPQPSTAPAATAHLLPTNVTTSAGGKGSQQRTGGVNGNGKVTVTNAASTKSGNNGSGPNNTSNNTTNTITTVGPSPTTLLTSKNSKNTPLLGALTRGEAAHQGASTGGEVEVLSSLIAHLPSSSTSAIPPSTSTATCPSPDRAATLSATPTANRAKPAHNNHTSTSSGQASFSARPSAASAILRSPQRGEQQSSSTAVGGRTSESARGSTSTTSYPAHRNDAVEESPNIHISVFAYRPTPEVSPCMGPSSVRSVDDGLSCPCSQSVSPAYHTASPVLPPPSDVTNAPLPLPAMVMVEVSGVADSREQNGTPTAVVGGDGASPHCLASTPPMNVAKPNLASLLSRSSSAGTPSGGSNGGQQASVKAIPTGPPPGSMAEKLLKSNTTNNNNNKSAMGLTASSVTSASSSISSVHPPPASSAKKGTPTPNSATPPPMPATTGAAVGHAQSLPTTKAAIERFLKEGEAPETLRHIKILAFSHEYPAEIKALFDLWAGNGIPPPDDAFGAYYWYVRKKIGRDLCMKHNGPGKAPGVGYGGCDYASRGQGQCRYHHQCLFCTKEDHGWFDEHKCGRYKTYQKELAKLKLTEDDIYELVEAYCK